MGLGLMHPYLYIDRYDSSSFFLSKITQFKYLRRNCDDDDDVMMMMMVQESQQVAGIKHAFEFLCSPSGAFVIIYTQLLPLHPFCRNGSDHLTDDDMYESERIYINKNWLHVFTYAAVIISGCISEVILL